MKNFESPRNRRRVDLKHDPDDRACLTLAMLGMSNRYICSQTGLSDSQVSYRLKSGALTKDSKLSRTSFRNGTSPLVQTMIAAATAEADARLIKHLDKNV